MQLTKRSKQEQGVILFWTFFQKLVLFLNFQSQAHWILDAHMNSQLCTTLPGLTVELHQWLLRLWMWAITKGEGDTQDEFFGGCLEVKWWTNYTDKKTEELFLSKHSYGSNLSISQYFKTCLLRNFCSEWFFSYKKAIWITRLLFYNCHRKTDCWS